MICTSAPRTVSGNTGISTDINTCTCIISVNPSVVGRVEVIDAKCRGFSRTSDSRRAHLVKLKEHTVRGEVADDDGHGDVVAGWRCLRLDGQVHGRHKAQHHGQTQKTGQKPFSDVCFHNHSPLLSCSKLRSFRSFKNSMISAIASFSLT